MPSTRSIGVPGSALAGILLPQEEHHHVWMPSATDAAEATDVRVIELPAARESFRSIRPIVDDLLASSHGGAADWQRLDSYLAEVEHHEGTYTFQPGLSANRRLSREAGAETLAIELGARLVNRAFGGIHRSIVWVGGIAEADSLSARMLFRAAVLGDACAPDYVWLGSVPPSGSDSTADLSHLVRLGLFSKFADSGFFAISGYDSRADVTVAAPIVRLARQRPPSFAAAHQALGSHNYDLGAEIVNCLSGEAVDDAVEKLRINGIIAANVGMTNYSDNCFAQAAASSRDDAVTCHLLCLRALLASKRISDLKLAESHCQAGLRLIGMVETGIADQDVDLEHAWLINALALIRALEYRQSNSGADLSAALNLERKAMDLVKSGSSAERVYLRYNLLANIAFLYEMRRDYKSAERIFSSAFAEASHLDAAPDNYRLLYRIAVLCAKAGELDRAAGLLADAQCQLSAEHWWAAELITRALGCIAWERDKGRTARDLFEQGLMIAAEARARRPVLSHFAELRYLSAHGFALPRLECARASELDLSGGTGSAVSSASPIHRLPAKLPAYIPEIDLDDIPDQSVNRVLSGVDRWRSGA